MSLNIHRALFVSLLFGPTLIVTLIKIHEPHHTFFNCLLVLYIVHLSVMFSYIHHYFSASFCGAFLLIFALFLSVVVVEVSDCV